MVRLRTFLATAVMLGITANADVVPVQIVPRGDGDLISTRGVESIDETSVTVTAPSSPALILEPLRKIRHGNTKRDRKAAMAPRQEETLYWGGRDGTVARLTVEMPGKFENIVNTEEFNDMVVEMHCPRNGTGRLKIRFADAADLDDAQDVWRWVNQEQDNHFTLVVGAGDCRWNDDRVVYTVHGLVYNDERETAVFDVQQTTWREAVHTYDLAVGKSAKEEVMAGRIRVRRRRGIFDDIGDWFKDTANELADWLEGAAGDVADTVGDVVDSVVDVATDVGETVVDAVDSIISPDLNPDFSIPFSSDLSNKGVTFKMNGIEVGAHCLTCKTSGSFNVEARFKARLGHIEQAWAQVSTQGINATAIIGLSVKGDLTDKLAEKTVPIFKISPAGIAIPGILTIGPTVSINLGAEISQIKGGVVISFGGTATIPPSTSRLDFLSKAGTTSSGWKPSFEAAPFTADTFIEARAMAYLTAAIGIEISAIESGFAAELSASLPYLAATLKAIHSFTCTACGSYENGIQGGLSMGTSIGVALKQKILGAQKTLWELGFYDAKLPEIIGFCQGFGPQGEACLAG